MQAEFVIYLEAFVAAADEGSFSAAARRLGLTPAAVSKNVARLEAGLGVRLFQRSTRSISLTAEGESLHLQVRMPWTDIADALSALRQGAGKPAGTLRVAMAPTVGRLYIVPLLEKFLQRYPDITLDLSFDNRQVDLIAQGYDVAIGGGIELTDGLIARELAPMLSVMVAAPAYLARHPPLRQPSQLAAHGGLLRRSMSSGRVVPWLLKNGVGEAVVGSVRALAVIDDPEAIARAAACGLGLAMLPLPHVLPLLDSGELLRVLPEWHGETRPLSIYYASRKLAPAKVRAFVEHVVDEVRVGGLRERFGAV
ncbi:LysR family transcriptional regulator [Duganella callida]|uniref:LysR family transcriptional regulator n=1 Tax=Duganella callida TaxID=2561932 RepID=A0A4Y9S6D8_9BURK|nr:LysR family transcriptional regulator [Duganella callida]TFW15601.1 LysR family transcriptional regulator [Duganella callida]